MSSELECCSTFLSPCSHFFVLPKDITCQCPRCKEAWRSMGSSFYFGDIRWKISQTTERCSKCTRQWDKWMILVSSVHHWELSTYPLQVGILLSPLLCGRKLLFKITSYIHWNADYTLNDTIRRLYSIKQNSNNNFGKNLLLVWFC